MQIGKGKQGVKIGEYFDAETARDDGNGILGYVQPAGDDPRWILYFTLKGDAIFYADREPGGAVAGDPIKVAGAKSRRPRAGK
jgi:hypothetical protein